MSFEEKMKQDLKKDLEIPEIVEQKIQDAYKEIGQGKLRMKKPDRRCLCKNAGKQGEGSVCRER